MRMGNTKKKKKKDFVTEFLRESPFSLQILLVVSKEYLQDTVLLHAI